MLYVGLDVHQCRSSMCILNSDGKVVKQEQINARWPQVIDRLRLIKEPFAVCYEASCGYGHLYDRIEPLASRVAVAHPGQLRLIFRSKKKHDRVDAAKLAKLLYLDEVPRVHVPGLQVRGWRKLIEFRQKLLGKRTASKNQIRAILRGNGIAGVRWQWSKKAIARLKEQPLGTDGEKLALELAIEELEDLSGKVKRVEKELAKIAAGHPGMTVLMTIPGVGIRTAEAFLAYVDDIKRFGGSRQVGAYFGLVPCLDSSAGKDRFGHITRDGPPTMRKLLCEAAWTAVRRDAGVKARFQRIMNNDPDRKKIAIVAIAHHLCRVMAAMLRSGEVWRPRSPSSREASSSSSSSNGNNDDSSVSLSQNTPAAGGAGVPTTRR
jgi:transposase